MGLEETGERIWRAMSISDRENFFDRLALEITGNSNRKSKWSNGLTLETIARISSYYDLPNDLRGWMNMAMTKDGFSIEELRREQMFWDRII